MELYITGVTTLALALLHIGLTFRVIQFRRQNGTAFGDSENRAFMKAIRGHSNASEQIPIALLTLGFAEYFMPGVWIIIAALLLVVGRILHGLYFAYDGTHFYFRFWGMLFTLIAQGVAIIALGIGLF